jgi:uncharacterized cupredoxin-like copper-binding protein
MRELDQNENLILIEDENESNQMKGTLKNMWKGIESGNVQIENSRIEKNAGQIMNFFL